MKQIHVKMSEDLSRPRNEHRGRIEELCQKVKFLDGVDRVMMTMYLKNGNTFRQIATLMGIHEGNISRRIRRITKKLIEGEYIICLRHSNRFTCRQMEIAKHYFLWGIPLRQLASMHNSSFYRMRLAVLDIKRTLKYIELEKGYLKIKA